jgi:hypothetical protein
MQMLLVLLPQVAVLRQTHQHRLLLPAALSVWSPHKSRVVLRSSCLQRVEVLH